MDTSSLLQLSNEIDQKYCSSFVKDPRSLEDLRADTESWYEEITSKLKCTKSDLDAASFNTNKVTKAILGEWMESVTDLLDRNDSVIQHLLRVLYLSKMELISSQQNVITLQKELLSSKNEQLQSIQSTVQNTVQSEIRSYSAVVTSNAPTTPTALSESNVKSAVRDVIEREDREMNLIIHGLEEKTEVNLPEQVTAVFESLGEKPRVEACRIGKKNDVGQSVRPVKVVFSNSTLAWQVLSKAKNLKQSKRFQAVYINPDRSPEERKVQKELLLQLKKIRKEQPELRHYIRHNNVCSEKRTTS